MKKTFSGRVLKYGDNINTDVIFPGKYTYGEMTPEEMAKHALEDLDPGFIHKVRPGDILAAGKNFGMGSSREQAAIALKYSGVSLIIASSFARIFFRNAVNAGMPVIKCPEAVAALEDEDEVTVDITSGTISTPRGIFAFPSYPEAVLDILNSNGLVECIRKKIKN